MAEETNETEIRTAWLAFVESVALLLKVQTDDQLLTHFISFRGEVLSFVKGKAFLDELDKKWVEPTPVDEKVKSLLLEELKAFSLAVNAHQEFDDSKSGWKGLLPRWLGRSSMVTGSVKDILDDGLHPLVKGGLIVFQELIDIFKER